MPGGGIVHKQENHHASQWNGGTCLVAADAADAPEHVWQGRYGWRRRFVDRRIFRRGQEQIFRVGKFCRSGKDGEDVRGCRFRQRRQTDGERTRLFLTKLDSRTQSQLLQFQQGAADHAADFLGKADADSDGSLSLDEFAAARAKELFAWIDGHGDGKLTESELGAFEESRGPGGADDMPPPPPPSGMQASASGEESGTTLADILAQNTDEDETGSSVSADFATQIQAYLQQLLSGYASQAKSGASTVNVSA